MTSERLIQHFFKLLIVLLSLTDLPRKLWQRNTQKECVRSADLRPIHPDSSVVVVQTHHYEGGASGVSGGTVKLRHILWQTMCKNNISNGDISRMPFGLNQKWKIFWLQSMIVNDCDDFEWIFLRVFFALEKTIYNASQMLLSLYNWLLYFIVLLSEIGRLYSLRSKVTC